MNTKQRTTAMIVLVIVFIVSGCQTGQLSDPTATTAPTNLLPTTLTPTLAPTQTPTLALTLTPMVTFTPTPMPNPILTVRVMTYNIWLGAGMEPGHAERGSNLNRLDDLITLVKQANPDILGLQEVNGWEVGDPTIMVQFASALNMNYYLAPTWRGFNLAIFSKFPILETENLSEYIGNNGALRAVLQTPAGQKLNVVVVHLDPTDLILRACEFDKLRQIMESYPDQPGILIGDINSLPDFAEVTYLTQGGWELVRNDGVDSIFLLSRLAWSQEVICFSTDASISDCILDTGISDHGPVGAAISFYDFKNPFSPPLSVTPTPVTGCSFDRTQVQPQNDTFDGPNLDETKWRYSGYGDGVVKLDGRLVMSTNSLETGSSAKIASTWSIPGDFDIQVDFEIGEGWGPPANEHLDGAIFGVNIEGQNYHITRLRRTGNSNADVFFAWSSTGTLNAEVFSDAVAGKVRLVRSGTTLSLQYDIGKGWEELGSVSVPESPAYVYLGNGTVNTSLAFTTYFDNFLVNVGSAVH